MTQEQVRDRRDLKIQALVEKVSELTANYENAAADYRVDITILSERLKQYEDQDGNPIVQQQEAQEPVTYEPPSE